MKEAHTLAKSAHTYRAAGDTAALTRALSDVFAETTGDSQSSQADFEMLAGLSEEVAGEIVKGLSAPRNDRLQTVDELAMASPDLPVGSLPGNFSVPANSTGQTTVAGSIGILLSTICCLASFGFIFLVIGGIVVNAIKKNTRS